MEIEHLTLMNNEKEDDGFKYSSYAMIMFYEHQSEEYLLIGKLKYKLDKKIRVWRIEDVKGDKTVKWTSSKRKDFYYWVEKFIYGGYKAVSDNTMKNFLLSNYWVNNSKMEMPAFAEVVAFLEKENEDV